MALAGLANQQNAFNLQLGEDIMRRLLQEKAIREARTGSIVNYINRLNMEKNAQETLRRKQQQGLTAQIGAILGTAVTGGLLAPAIPATAAVTNNRSQEAKTGAGTLAGGKNVVPPELQSSRGAFNTDLRPVASGFLSAVPDIAKLFTSQPPAQTGGVDVPGIATATTGPAGGMLATLAQNFGPSFINRLQNSDPSSGVGQTRFNLFNTILKQILGEDEDEEEEDASEE